MSDFVFIFYVGQKLIGSYQSNYFLLQEKEKFV